jgi:hypothetical protein
MLKFAQSFPQIRLAIYGVASALLAGLVIAGVVTEGQSSNILTYVGLGLGALATLLAGLNVPKASPVEVAVSNVGDLLAQVPGVNQAINKAIADAQAAVAPTVDQIRAQLELQLGSHQSR